jgi:hypothetical protein
MAKSIFDRRSSEEPAALPTVTPVAYNAPRGLTASAVRVDMKNKKEVDAINKRRVQDKWQEEAWEYYDLIGEIKYAANLVASIMSRVNLYTGYVEKSANVPTEISAVEQLDPEFIQQAEDILYLLESGNGGTSGLLRSAALNLFVTGECWLVNEPARFSTGEPSKYQVRSVQEIISTTGRNAQVVIKPRRDAKPSEYLPLPTNGYISRIWRNHPRFSDEADSSLRGLLDICDQLLLMDRAAATAAKSRLSAGLLFVPDGFSNAADVEGDETTEYLSEEAESFEEELIAGITKPVEDVNSAAALMPTILRGPEDLGEKIRLIPFSREADPQLNDRAERLLERILGGLDIPKDVAAGMSSVKYSNAIIIEEQLYKAHIEPMILLICDCLTIGFLRPALRQQGWPEEKVNRAVVWYDPSAITAKPSKAEAAVTLYGMKLISGDAVLRANGFSPEDAPSEMERVQRMAEERAILSDAMSETILSTILPEDLKNEARNQALAMSDPASANALSTALGGEAAPAAPGSDTVEADPATSNVTAPPTLMEP